MFGNISYKDLYINHTSSDCASQALVSLLSLNCQVPKQILETFKSVPGMVILGTADIVVFIREYTIMTLLSYQID